MENVTGVEVSIYTDVCVVCQIYKKIIQLKVHPLVSKLKKWLKKKGRPRKLTNSVSNDKKDTNTIATNTSENIDIDNKLVNFSYYNSYTPNCNSIDDFCTLDQYISTPSINVFE